MENRNTRVQVIILFLLILANFIAQIPYYLHLYYKPNFNQLAQLKSGIPMIIVSTFFILASILFFKRTIAGYWLMLTFLATEFLFYLWNAIGSVIHGYGLFFQLSNPDLLLRAVFAIGYINLFASGYFLCLLIIKRANFLHPQERAKPTLPVLPSKLNP